MCVWLMVSACVCGCVMVSVSVYVYLQHVEHANKCDCDAQGADKTEERYSIKLYLFFVRIPFSKGIHPKSMI